MFVAVGSVGNTNPRHSVLKFNTSATRTTETTRKDDGVRHGLIIESLQYYCM